MTKRPPLNTDVEEILEKLLACGREYEFRSFVLGIERPRDYDREEHEELFRSLKIRLGTELCEHWPQRHVDFDRPEVRLDVRLEGAVRIVPRAAPLFLGGRYLKLARGIPAGRWRHQPCKGRGCSRCDFTGNVHGPSIQELVQPAFLAATQGEEVLFHGAGREDVDVLMLGTGRPFVIEVRQPRRRFVDLAALARRANEDARGYAELRTLCFATREEMVAAKACAAEKTYRVRIRFAEGMPPPQLASALDSLVGQDIRQLSPTRVMKRRGENTVRLKRVVESRPIGPDGADFVWEVRTSAGTYVKELVSGDDGRTQPSVASAAGATCHCASLEVFAVHWEPPWEGCQAERSPGAGAQPPAADSDRDSASDSASDSERDGESRQQ